MPCSSLHSSSWKVGSRICEWPCGNIRVIIKSFCCGVMLDWSRIFSICESKQALLIVVSKGTTWSAFCTDGTLPAKPNWSKLLSATYSKFMSSFSTLLLSYWFIYESSKNVFSNAKEMSNCEDFASFELFTCLFWSSWKLLFFCWSSWISNDISTSSSLSSKIEMFCYTVDSKSKYLGFYGGCFVSSSIFVYSSKFYYFNSSFSLFSWSICRIFFYRSASYSLNCARNAWIYFCRAEFDCSCSYCFNYNLNCCICFW